MSIIKDFISLFYPAYCQLCKGGLVHGEQHICTTCKAALPVAGYHQQPHNPVMDKMLGLAPVNMASAYLVFRKGGRAQRLLHLLKYDNRYDIGLLLGTWYGHDLLAVPALNNKQLIMPVPVHQHRLKERGYNQSAAFGQGLAAVLNIPFAEGVLAKPGNKRSQVRLNREQRWHNQHKAYAVTDRSLVEGKHLILVDDVITTGATVVTCANCLIEAGAASVAVLAIASVN